MELFIAGGRGHEADDAGAEGRDDLHPPLQRRLQRRVEGDRACRRCCQVGCPPVYLKDFQ